MNLLIILPPAENTNGVYERSLREKFPQLNIHCAAHHSEVGAHIAEAQILMTFSPMMADHVLRAAARLEWIQVLGSGVDGITNLPSLSPSVLITSGAGVQAVPVSEAALALMLALARQLPRMIRNQDERQWQRWPSLLLHGRVIGILGVGAIAAELARKCEAFGMRVLGVSSHSRAVAGFERVYARAELARVAGEVDYLVVLTPYSPETHHLVNATVLAAMKPSAFLVNVARGGIVDESALLQTLQGGAIAGAALDVFSEEPLPAQHALWTLPNVIISPHLGGLNSSYPRHIMPLLVHNLECFIAGNRAAMSNIIQG